MKPARLHLHFRRPGQHGFTLIEVVLSLGIISFALVVLLGLLVIGMNVMQQSTTQATITMISTNVASQLRSGDWVSEPHPQEITLYFTRDGAANDEELVDGYTATLSPLAADANFSRTSWRLEVSPNAGDRRARFVSRLSPVF